MEGAPFDQNGSQPAALARVAHTPGRVRPHAAAAAPAEVGAAADSAAAAPDTEAAAAAAEEHAAWANVVGTIQGGPAAHKGGGGASLINMGASGTRGTTGIGTPGTPGQTGNTGSLGAVLSISLPGPQIPSHCVIRLQAIMMHHNTATLSLLTHSIV